MLDEEVLRRHIGRRIDGYCPVKAGEPLALTKIDLTPMEVGGHGTVVGQRRILIPPATTIPCLIGKKADNRTKTTPGRSV